MDLDVALCELLAAVSVAAERMTADEVDDLADRLNRYALARRGWSDRGGRGRRRLVKAVGRPGRRGAGYRRHWEEPLTIEFATWNAELLDAAALAVLRARFEGEPARRPHHKLLVRLTEGGRYERAAATLETTLDAAKKKNPGARHDLPRLARYCLAELSGLSLARVQRILKAARAERRDRERHFEPELERQRRGVCENVEAMQWLSAFDTPEWELALSEMGRLYSRNGSDRAAPSSRSPFRPDPDADGSEDYDPELDLSADAVPGAARIIVAR